MGMAHDNLWDRIEAFQLDDPESAVTFTQKLACENAWSIGFANRVVEEYRRFAFLAMTAGHEVSPSEQVDQAWHLHLVYTRSYWEDFCEGALGKALHHTPSKGGGTALAHYRELYVQTLESYRVAFGEAPPSDIWPCVEERFGNSARFVRTDKKEAWVVRKPWRWMAPVQLPKNVAPALAVMPIALLATSNPLDFKGTDFLQFYLVSFATALFVATLLRRLLRQGEHAARHPLDPYQAACLASGTAGVVIAAVASLVHRGALKVTSESGDSNEFHLRVREGTPEGANELEQRVVAACGQLGGCRFGDIVSYAEPAVQKIKYRLEAWGLLVPSDRIPASVWAPVLALALVVGLGAAKLVVGIQRDKPVALLVLLLFVSGAFLVGFLKRPLRTVAGDAHLRRLRSERGDLNDTNRLKSAETGFEDIAMAAALFGLPVVGFNEMLLLPMAWEFRDGPAAAGGTGWSSTGTGSSCGGGGGGCGGGGCGGCGGD